MIRKPVLLCIVIIHLAVVTTVLPSASAAGPVIYSQYTRTPPIIDGNFPPGEWSNPQIIFQAPTYPDTYVLPSYVYFVHDDLNLYVMVDAVGDTSDGSGDVCVLWFGYKADPPYANVKIKITGSSGTEITAPFHAKVGYGSSPNAATSHKIYEFSIPLTYINAKPGEGIEFCSPFEKFGGSIPYDQGTTHDNVWPMELGTTPPPYPLDMWGRILFSQAVGGVIMPTNRSAILTPYLALTGLLAVAFGTLAARRKL